jgi:N-acetylglucosaminyl-diphospho-decaprenol L-rhamnosyltransferase
MPPFSVVVVTHNSAAELTQLLDSLERHLHETPEIVVVDADSSDGTVEAAGGRASVVELGHNPGFGAAANAGVATASAAVTLVMNPDIVLLDDGLATLAARARTRRALLVPRLLNDDGSVQRTAHPLPGRVRAMLPALVHPRLLPPPLRLAADPWRSTTQRRVGWAVAACVAAQTELLRSLGPFDSRHFLFYEDLDLCLRARDEGVATELHPDVRLRHTGGHSTQRAYGGEPYELLARRRRETVGARLGRRALALDDASEALTFATRSAARALLGRDRSVQRARLAALRRARRPPEQPR